MTIGEAEHGAMAYLRLADRLLPGRVVGFYLVGSAALDSFRPGRSDTSVALGGCITRRAVVL